MLAIIHSALWYRNPMKLELSDGVKPMLEERRRASCRKRCRWTWSPASRCWKGTWTTRVWEQLWLEPGVLSKIRNFTNERQNQP